MRWVEIIEIRSLSNTRALMEPDLTALLTELAAEKKPERIEMYCHGELKTDWSVHLHYISDSEKASRSLLGLRLVSLLRELGFVHHSVWKEVRMLETTNGD
jgi:hypothetical protein